jgi:hypothetical protein
MSVPGIGPIISSAMVAAIGAGDVFTKGRDFAACLGLVPKQISTGDRTILGKISRRGNRYLRVLFVQVTWPSAIHSAGLAADSCRTSDLIGAWSTRLAFDGLDFGDGTADDECPPKRGARQTPSVCHDALKCERLRIGYVRCQFQGQNRMTGFSRGACCRASSQNASVRCLLGRTIRTR